MINEARRANIIPLMAVELPISIFRFFKSVGGGLGRSIS